VNPWFPRGPLLAGGVVVLRLQEPPYVLALCTLSGVCGPPAGQSPAPAVDGSVDEIA